MHRHLVEVLLEDGLLLEHHPAGKGLVEIGLQGVPLRLPPSSPR